MNLSSFDFGAQDVITLRGLRATGRHGVFPEEHQHEQEFVVDLEMRVDTRRAGHTDDLADTISYADIAQACVEVISGEHCDLIETIAERIAARVFEFPVRSVRVSVHKPQAPIPHEFSDVFVTISRTNPMWERGGRIAVISLGSNLGQSAWELDTAVTELGEIGDVLAYSPIYRSAPVLAPGQDPQPDYLNAIVLLRTELSPAEVLHALLEIEAEHGRVRTGKWQPRTLDLDMISMGELRISTAELTLPHPRASQRRFVLQPWLDVDPDAHLDGVRVADLLEAVSDQPLARWMDSDA
ncbi:dihydroneopterin aldolase [Trueperella sp. LYQ143]|uniref:dihydroneopterin aldolase n=1 Tax=unclassified Trueperella TaxID=2630174 RepID=UPI003983C2A2